MDLESQVVLVVDDDETILLSVEAILLRRGYCPISASAPLQALREAGDFQREIHLLSTDVVMPEMDGIALAQRSRTHVEATARPSARPADGRRWRAGSCRALVAHLNGLVHLIETNLAQACAEAILREVSTATMILKLWSGP